MAAHVLTTHGLQVLMLEAGKKLPIEQELRSMQWPYDHPRRGDEPPGSHHLSFNEYTIRKPPYAKGAAFKHVYSYVGGWSGSDYVKNILVDEKDHPFTGNQLRLGAGPLLGGQDQHLGPPGLRLSDYDFKAKSHDGYGEDWPIAYADVEPYYDKVDLYLGISGVKENLPHLPDSQFQRPSKLNAGEVKLRESLKKGGQVLTPYRAGVTTDGLKHNKYRSKCYGRGACDRRPGGCDIHAVFDSPTGLIYPAMDTGNLTIRPNSIAHEILVDKNTGKARGVAFLDSTTRKSYEAKAKVVIVGASTLESARLLLLSRSAQTSQRPRQLERARGHNFCEHVMGPGVTGLIKELVGKPHTLDDVDRRVLYPALPELEGPSARVHPWLRLRGEQRPFHVPGARHGHAGIRRPVQEERARSRRRVHQYGRLRRGPGSVRELRRPGSGDEGRLGDPGATLPLSVLGQRAQDGRGHGRDRARDARGRGNRGGGQTRRSSPRGGRSMSWARRAWGPIPRPRS